MSVVSILLVLLGVIVGLIAAAAVGLYLLGNAVGSWFGWR